MSEPVMDDELIVELGAVIVARGRELRLRLQKMNPVNNPEYEELFRLLVDVDTDLRTWRGKKSADA
jgi:hypothetical protein